MKKKIKPHPTIALDFDGVLNQYSGYRGKAFFGKPRRGVKAFLHSLAEAEINVIVFTTRKDFASLERWFAKYSLPQPRKITNEKPLAQAYVDDRAVRFTGNYTKLSQDLKTFGVYWRPDTKPFNKLKKR